MEIPLVVEWPFDPSSGALWFSSSTVAPKACAREAGHRTAAAHAAHREPNTGRSREAPEEAAMKWKNMEEVIGWSLR